MHSGSDVQTLEVFHALRLEHLVQLTSSPHSATTERTGRATLFVCVHAGHRLGVEQLLVQVGDVWG